DPWKVISEHGADAVRLYLCGQSQVWLPKRFDPRQIPDVAGGFLNTLRSTYDFFRRYAQDWRPPAEEDRTPSAERPSPDRWLLAPAGPFISDWVHRALTGTSVHLAPFPVDRGHREPELLAAMNTVRRLASLARAARESRNLRVRQPLARMQLAVPAAVQGPALSDLLDILAAEVNVKSVQVVASDHNLVRLRGKANFRTLGKRYGRDTQQAVAAAAELTPEQLQALEQS